MLVRQSDLKQFGTCARQWKYSRIDDLGRGQIGSLTVLGTVWHFAADVYETYDFDLDLAKRTFLYYWERPHLVSEPIDFWHRRTTYEGLQKRGLLMLEKYHELAPWRQGRLLGTEITFRVPIGDHELTGTIDKLWARRGQQKLEVVDWKTGSFVPEKLKFNLQFTAYTYATTHPEFWQSVPGHENDYWKYRYWERGGFWFHARAGKMFNAGTRSDVDYKRLLLAVQSMDDAIQANVFPLDISGESCGYCPFSEGICGSEVASPVSVPA